MRAGRLSAFWVLVLAASLLAGACDAPEVIPRQVEVEAEAAGVGEEPAREESAGRMGEAEAAGELSRARVAAILEEAEARREALAGREPPLGVSLSLARMYDSAGKYPDAIHWYGRAIDAAEPVLRDFQGLAGRIDDEPEQPNECATAEEGVSFEAAAARAAAMLEDGDAPAALACYRASLAMAANALRFRAELRHKLEEHLRAFEDLKRAAVIRPDDPEIFFLLGAMAFEVDPRRLGRERAELARDAWTRFVELAPEHPLAGHVREGLPHVDELLAQGRFGG